MKNHFPPDLQKLERRRDNRPQRDRWLVQSESLFHPNHAEIVDAFGYIGNILLVYQILL